jgi:hypothetical protein
MSWPTRPTSAERPGPAEPKLAAKPLADEFIESYVCWREACEDVRTGFEHWGACRPSQRGLAFESYRAALDHEEYAAHIHCEWTERLLAAKQ